MTVIEYVQNKMIRDNLPYIYLPTGIGYYLLNGEPISPERLEKLYPITIPFVTTDTRKWKGENSDRTKNWIAGKKSY